MNSNVRNLNVGNLAGFSLLELLVTLVILSVGLLGLGLMQTTGLTLTKSAYARTQAMMLANDMADRIRANEASAANYVATTATSIVNTTCDAPNNCLGPAMAVSDLSDWSNRVITELPGGKGQILNSASAAVACPGNAATTVTDGFMRILVTWNEASNGANLTGGETAGDCYQFDFVF